MPWLLRNKSEAGTLAGTKFSKFIGRWLTVDFCHTKAFYDYYKSMDQTSKKMDFECKTDINPEIIIKSDQSTHLFFDVRVHNLFFA